MSIFDRYGNFVYLNDGSLSSEEEAEEQKRRQEQLCELMSMYQRYCGISTEQQYVSRGSKLRCQYGTELVQLDCLEDYGIYRGVWPLLTTLDCKPENIHDFGSCLCPEVNYLKRLPMTVEKTADGKKAIKAVYNQFPHICIPLVDEEHGWRQIDTDLLVEVNVQGYAPMLLSNAVLVCQYGGIITVEEVPEKQIKLEYWEFEGKSFMVAAEGEIPYIYSTLEFDTSAENKYPEWKGEFDKDMDLTFGIGHSIKTEEEFNLIKKQIEECNDNNRKLKDLTNQYYENDIKEFVDKVNEFCLPNTGEEEGIFIEEESIFLEQCQFDALVMLQFNCNFKLENSSLGKELDEHRGEMNPKFNEENIVEGFTYTKFQGERINGLVTRRNNELNLFFNDDYNYYDSKEKVINQNINYIPYP